MRWLSMLAVVSLCVMGVNALVFEEEFYDHHDLLPHMSLKPPFFVVNGAVQSWQLSGSAAYSIDHLRLTSSVKGQRGQLVHTGGSIAEKNFELFVEFRVHGQAQGADGVAVWLTSAPIVEGPVLGGPVQWKGFAVMMDSFDNDGRGNNPRISLVVNDGRKMFKPDTDGIELELAGCVYGFRNAGAQVMRIIVQNNLVSVWVGPTASPISEYHACIRDAPVTIDGPLFAAITAATGGLVDDQDVIAVAAFKILDTAQATQHHDEKLKLEEQQRIDQLVRSGLRRDDSATHHEQGGGSAGGGSAGGGGGGGGGQRRHERYTLPPLDDADDKSIPEHHTRAPLAFHFNSVFKELNNVHQEDHPSHQDWAQDLKLPELKNLKTDEERYAFILDAIYALEKHADYFILAFESILNVVDQERYRVAENHHQFASAFQSLYDNVAMKTDVENVLQALAGKQSLLKATRRIHKRVDQLLDDVEGPDSPVGVLGAIAKQIDPQVKQMEVRHTSNRDSLAAVHKELEALLGVSSRGMGWLDWIMVIELILLALFVVVQIRNRNQHKRSTLL